MPESQIANPQPVGLSGQTSGTGPLNGQRAVELFVPSLNNLANAITVAVTQGAVANNFAYNGGIQIACSTATSVNLTTAGNFITSGVQPGMQILATTTANATTLGLAATPLYVNSITSATSLVMSAAATATGGPVNVLFIQPVPAFSPGQLVQYGQSATDNVAYPLVPALGPVIANAAAVNNMAGIVLNTANPGQVVEVCVQGPVFANVGTGGVTAGQLAIPTTSGSGQNGTINSAAAPANATSIGYVKTTAVAGATALIVARTV